ncbi:hypothetical protein LAM21_25475, partial [Mycobacterium tuberculosis]|nr:hypothetical protein [Mycobacterium tuberculosis]
MIKERIVKSFSKEYPSARVVVNCTKMAGDLIVNGITPRKSHILTFPQNLSSELISSYMQGYFDGDGNIHL